MRWWYPAYLDEFEALEHLAPEDDMPGGEIPSGDSPFFPYAWQSWLRPELREVRTKTARFRA